MTRNGGIDEQYARHQQAPPIDADLLQTDPHSGTYSPTRQEQIHMKPSNFFQDITEDQFNQKEAEKNEYKNELLR